MRRFLQLTPTLLVLAAACAPATDPVDGASSALAGAPALPIASASTWLAATPGCEGRLDGDERFEMTTPDGLVVVLRGTTAICLDSLESVELELDALGLDERAEELHELFYNTWHARGETRSTGPREGDPNPQPSLGGLTARTGVVAGDPNPQPSGPSKLRGDPNPQPSSESSGGEAEGDPNPQPSGPPAAPVVAELPGSSSDDSSSSTEPAGDAAPMTDRAGGATDPA
jgi:hypothetical protein